jgi:hypothetical protein
MQAETAGHQPHMFLASVLKQGDFFVLNFMFIATADKPLQLNDSYQESLNLSELTLDAYKKVQCFQFKYTNPIITFQCG